jgi:ribosomal protein L29
MGMVQSIKNFIEKTASSQSREIESIKEMVTQFKTELVQLKVQNASNQREILETLKEIAKK